jgi:hypothetical protein
MGSNRHLLERDLERDATAATRLAGDADRTPDQFGTFLHAQQPESPAPVTSGLCGDIEATAVIFDGNLEEVARRVEGDQHVRGHGMLLDVAQCFLDDPQDGHFRQWMQVQWAGAGAGRLQPVFASESLDVLAKGANEAKLVEGERPQVVDEFSYFLDMPRQALGDIAQVRLHLAGRRPHR